MVPSFQHEAVCAVLTVFLNVVVLEHAEGLTRTVFPRHVGRIKYVTQFVTAQAICAGVPRVQFGTEFGTPIFVPWKGRPLKTDIASESLQRAARIGHFQHPRNYKLQRSLGKKRRWKHLKLIDKMKTEIRTTHFLTHHIIMYETIDTAEEGCTAFSRP